MIFSTGCTKVSNNSQESATSKNIEVLKEVRKSGNENDFVPDEYVLQVEGRKNVYALPFGKADGGVEILNVFTSGNVSIVTVKTKDAKNLENVPGVKSTDKNYIYKALAIPNDPMYRYQWHYNSINLPMAWDLIKRVQVMI